MKYTKIFLNEQNRMSNHGKINIQIYKLKFIDMVLNFYFFWKKIIRSKSKSKSIFVGLQQKK
jgi:hypothetical protein